MELTLAPYAKGRGPVFSVQLWHTMQTPDHYPYTGMVRFGYRLSMDGQVIDEGETAPNPLDIAWILIAVLLCR